jgi:hypothetical protein
MTIREDNGLTTSDLAFATPQVEEREAKSFMPSVNAHPDDGTVEPVFSPDEVSELRPMWIAIQTKFIDEPRQSVQEADGLVASTIQRLAESFAKERGQLESQWAKGGDVSTEDLRLALRRYRSFFDRLLSA